MQNFDARLKYTEQYCMSNTITASCSLGSKHYNAMHAHTSLAGQRVKGYHKIHMAWQLTYIPSELKEATVVP